MEIGSVRTAQLGVFLEGMAEAAKRIVALDRDIVEAVSVTLRCSLAATLGAAVCGVPVGVVIGRGRFHGKRLLIVLFQALMAVPTVVIGLILYAMLTRYGPFGDLNLLLTPWAIMLGEFFLILPITVSLTISAVSDIDPVVAASAQTIGAGWWRTSWVMLGEARSGVAAALVASFGRAVGEIGVAYMVGGNVRHFSRTVTTAIAMNTEQGELGLAFGLGMVLLLMAFAATFTFHLLRRWGKTHE